MAEHADLSSFALATLRAAAGVTALVVDGASGVVESGDLDAQTLEAAQLTRRGLAVAKRGKALAVLVQDLGEQPQGETRQAACSVFVYDRGAGYANIRTVREAVITALLHEPVRLVRGAGIVALSYSGRSGHLRFDDFDLDYEQIDFGGPLVFAANQDTYS
ncbi:MAG: hypothetical protein JXB35_10435 [Anaerolineae bacterium]|nr:hypothetical protein [Anaerolineae bacterium]